MYNEYEIENYEFIVKRINKFLFDRKIILAIPKTYMFEGKKLKEGLIVKYEEKEVLVSENENDCGEVEEEIRRLLELPKDWCVEESKMREYLLEK